MKQTLTVAAVFVAGWCLGYWMRPEPHAEFLGRLERNLDRLESVLGEAEQRVD